MRRVAVSLGPGAEHSEEWTRLSSTEPRFAYCATAAIVAITDADACGADRADSIHAANNLDEGRANTSRDPTRVGSTPCPDGVRRNDRGRQ
jgi:hypothetical protein